MGGKRKATGEAAAAVLKKPSSAQQEDTAPTLTAGALRKHDQQLLQEFKDGKRDETALEKALGPAGMQRAWQNFAYARKSNPEIETAFGGLKGSKGTQSNAKKRLLLFAWLKDSGFGSNFMNVMTSIEATNKKGSKFAWKTWKEICDKHGEDEARAMVKAGTIASRKNPADNRFYQFLSQEDTVKLTLQQRVQVSGVQSGKVSSAELSAFSGAAMGDLDENMMEDLLKRQGMPDLPLQDIKALKKGKEKDEEGEDAEGEAEEEDDAEGLPPDLAATIGLGKSSGGKPKGKAKATPEEQQHKKEEQEKAKLEKERLQFEKKVDVHSQVGDKDSQAKATQKAATMHALMSQTVRTLKSDVGQLNKSKTAYNAVQTQAIIEKLEKSISNIDKVLVSSASVEVLKKHLVHAAVNAKLGNKKHLELKALLPKST